MAEPAKYLKIVADLLSLYQRELIRIYKKYPHEQPIEFNKLFSTTLVRLKQAEINKAIEDGVSVHCQRMVDHLKGNLAKPKEERLNKTSVEARRNLKSQVGHRLMGMTGGLRRYPQEQQAIEEESQLNDIIQSYKIQEQLVPRMRMKWKSGHQSGERVAQKEISTIGSNNIHLLSYAIPEIENSIRRLSFQRSPKSTKDRELQIYRTLESRSAKKKFIPRLF